MASSFIEKVQEIWTITEKELLHCYRDAHVVVYSIVLPIVFYPVLVIGASEFALWREGLSERSPMKVCIDKDSAPQLPEFIKAIKEESKVNLVDSETPLDELRDRKIDCYAVLKKDHSGLISYLNPSSDRFLETKLMVKSAAEIAKVNAIKLELERKKVPAATFDIYSVKFESLAEIEEVKTLKESPHKYALLKVIAIGVLCIYTLVIIQSGTVYPALTAFTLEVEKKTKSTTQLIPIAPWIIVLGKFFCVVFISFVTAIINLTSFVLVLMYFVLKVPHTPKIVSTVVNQVSALDIVSILFVFFHSIILLSSAYCLVAAQAKSFKEAQNTSSFVLIVTMMLPAVAIIPGVKLDLATVFIPLSNLVLACKGIVSDEYSLPIVFLAIALNLALSLVFLYFSKVCFLNLKPKFVNSNSLPQNEEILGK